MTNTAIQLYVLREHESSLPELIRTVSDAGFAAVEFAFRLPDADQDAVRDALDETGTEVAGAHVPVERLTDDFDETVARYRRLGCETLVVPSVDESHFESESGVEKAADSLTRLGERLDDRDMRLCYHNHAREFVRIGDRWALDALVEATEDVVSFQLDLPSARCGGADPAALLDRVGKRAQSVHFYDRDVDTKEVVAFGDGDIDLAGCVAAATAAGVDWVIYEGDYERDSLDGAASKLSELLAD